MLVKASCCPLARVWYDRIRRVCEKKEAKKRKNVEADNGKENEDREDHSEDDGE